MRYHASSNSAASARLTAASKRYALCIKESMKALGAEWHAAGAAAHEDVGEGSVDDSRLSAPGYSIAWDASGSCVINCS